MSKDSTDLVPFNQLKADIEVLVAPTLKIKVTDFQSGQAAIDVAKQVKEFAKRVETTRKLLVDPLNQRVKTINEYAKTIAKPLLDAESHIKAQLVAFEMEQERIRAEERRKAEEEQRRKEAELLAKQEAERQTVEASLAREVAAASIFGDDEESPEATAEAKLDAFEEKQLQEQAVLQAESKAREFDIEQMGIKNAAKVWKCEVEDIEKVPREFLVVTLNEKAVLAAARAGVKSIPGVRLWQETTVRIGSKTRVPRLALESNG